MSEYEYKEINELEPNYNQHNVKYFTLKNFKFNNGEILEEAVVEYTTLGTPKYDEKGLISNAVLYFHGAGSNYSDITKCIKTVGPDLIFDTNKFFIIAPTALGHPGSASPSNTGLKANFPNYDIYDIVNFQYKFIQEKFGLNKIKGVFGTSMGGFEVLAWACKYPNSIDFAIPLVSSHKVGGHTFALSYVMNCILKSDSDYKDGFYETPLSESLLRSLRLASHAKYTFGFSREYYRYNTTNKKLKECMEEFARENMEWDVNDQVYINNLFINYDLTEDIENITAKVLIIAINQDQFFPPSLDAIPLSKMIKNNKLVIYDSELGHLGTSELEKVEKEVRDFLKEFEY